MIMQLALQIRRSSKYQSVYSKDVPRKPREHNATSQNIRAHAKHGKGTRDRGISSDQR